ncbi:MAG: hypothetical protein LBO72_07320 [Helicobacteraceae bacterium]|jgi:hypothetical protein|nr:hypothetical protein [Helicobacteraceae bacterium]
MNEVSKAARLLSAIKATKAMLRRDLGGNNEIAIYGEGVRLRDSEDGAEIVLEYENALKAARWIIEMLGAENVKD